MSEQRIIQPLVVMPPPVDPAGSYIDEEAERFVEDTEVETGLTFQEWVVRNRPQPVQPEQVAPFAEDVPEI